METIVIFTDWDAINVCQGYDASWVPMDEPIKNISISREKEILLVYDSINSNNEKLQELYGFFKDSQTVYVLHHNKPEIDFLDNFKLTLEAKGCEVILTKKHHIDSEYYFIQGIDQHGIKDFNKESIDEIVGKLKVTLSANSKINTSLNFLHKCLLEQPGENEIDVLINQFNLIEEESDTLKKLTEGNTYENISAARDVLLKAIPGYN